MTFSLPRVLAIITLSALMVALPTKVGSQAYPSKPIHLIVGYGAGGASDITVRRISKALSHILGQPIIVENRPGGSGVLAAQRVTNAEPDGHTVLFADSRVLYTNWKALPNLPYQPESFEYGPVFLKAPFILVAHRDSGIHAPVELKSWLEKDQERLNFVTAGINSPHHTLLQQLEKATATEFNHIPMKGDAQAMSELLSARVQLGIVGPVNASAHLENSDMRPLAVLWDKRLEDGPFKELPTLSELGIEGVVNDTVIAWAFPKGTPDEVIDLFSSAVQRVLARPGMSKELLEIGFIPYSESREVVKDKVKESVK